MRRNIYFSISNFKNKIIYTFLLYGSISSFNASATNYTWSGITSSNWALATNWTPNGVPSINDNVTINGYSNYRPILDSSTSVNSFSITESVLTISEDTLIIHGTSTFINSRIEGNDGVIIIDNNSTTYFSGTSISSYLNIRTNTIKLNRSSFFQKLEINKIGPNPGYCAGGNIFHSIVSIENNGSGALVMGVINNDQFNDSLFLSSIDGLICMSHESIGNIYQGPIIIRNRNIKFNYYGSSTFNGDIILENIIGDISFGGIGNNIGSHISDINNTYEDSILHYQDSVNAYPASALMIRGRVRGNIFRHDFEYNAGDELVDCSQSGSSCLSPGKKIITNGFMEGSLQLSNFIQLESGNINLNLTNTAKIDFESGTKFNADLVVNASEILLNGAVFNGAVYITQHGSGSSLSNGGNQFSQMTTLVNDGTGTFSLGNVSEDIFNGETTIQNNQGTLLLNYSVFNGNSYLKNYCNSTENDRFIIGNTGACQLNGNINITNDYPDGITSGIMSGMAFGIADGYTNLNNDGVLNIVDGFKGKLTLKNFWQLSVNSQSITLTDTNSQLILGPGSIFNGDFSFNGPRISLNGVGFNASAYISRTSNLNDTCNGGNFFNGITTIKDVGNLPHKFLLSYVNEDIYNGSVTFIQEGSGLIYPNYTSNSYFSRDVYVDCNASPIHFGENGGLSVFKGEGRAQSINKVSAYPAIFKKLQISTQEGETTTEENVIVSVPAGNVKINCPITVSGELLLTKGILITDSINLLKIADNCIVTYDSSASFVSGPIEKTGNDAFLFPLGIDTFSSGGFHPLKISSPGSVNDVYVAQYFTGPTNIVNKMQDVEISDCEYWTLKRLSGSSEVNVLLGWNSNSCTTDDTSKIVIAAYEKINDSSGVWKNLGKTPLVSSQEQTGRITSFATIGTSEEYVLTIGLLTSNSYAVMQRNLDAGYYFLKKKMLFFCFNSEYKSGTLNYKIYNFNRAVISNCGSLVKNYGDNRYILDIGSICNGSFSVGEMYTLEVLDEKMERYFLKFVYE